VREQLVSGDLRVLLPKHSIDAGAIYAVHAHGRQPPPKVKLFIDHLIEHVAA
jgi:DNA-binding transcriptional LysR family regulator